MIGLTTPSATQLVDAPARTRLRDWRARLRIAVYSLYRECPELPIDGGSEGLAELIDEGRAAPTTPASVTGVTAEALAGAIFHELCLAATREDGPPVESELVPTLMYSAVLPYVGAEAAAEELRIPPPPR